jgi:ATP-dependent RNA helicase DDX19/DBP5
MSEEDKKPEEVVEAPAVKEEETPKTEEAPPAAETAEVVDGELDDEVAEATIKARKEEDDSSDLTKRLQKLALERQKQSRGDRLKVIQADTGSHLSSAKTFQEMDLPKHLLDAIFAMGFDRPSAIQEEGSSS